MANALVAAADLYRDHGAAMSDGVAYTKTGDSCLPDDYRAICWTAVGALIKSAPTRQEMRRLADALHVARTSDVYPELHRFEGMYKHHATERLLRAAAHRA